MFVVLISVDQGVPSISAISPVLHIYEQVVAIGNTGIIMMIIIITIYDQEQKHDCC